MKEKIFFSFFALICVAAFALAVRGNHGNPTSTELNSIEWKEEGPFELSPERGRYALAYSLVEDKSFQFSLPVARFTTPDLGYTDGKYVSLFAPGVSYVLIPGYILGKMFGAAQVGAYAMIALFAVLNGLLIYLIARALGAKAIPAAIGAMAFLFGSPAFAYGVTLYQHHVSTFLILASLAMLLKTRSLWATAVVWFFCAWSIPVDYPNLVLMAPIGLYALGRLVTFFRQEGGVIMRFHSAGVVTSLTVLIPLLFFTWFNTMSYGNPWQLSGTVQAVKEIDELGLPTRSALDEETALMATSEEVREKTAVGFFKARNMLNGLYVQFVSPDRGIIFYTPIMLFSILGAIALHKRNPSALTLMLSVIGAAVVLYSLWGDPWGGYAFGSRYLIPAYSLLSILVALALQTYGRKISFVLLLYLTFIYSASVNSLGAITTSALPPSVEIASLEALSGKDEEYTYMRNWKYLTEGKSKSYVYNQLAHPYLTPFTYYLGLVGILTGFYGILLTFWYLRSRRAYEQ